MQPRVFVLLEYASLETVKVGQNYELLNCDDHVTLMKKHGRDPADERPDIVHQCLLMLLDSPLNKAGLLQVYIRTKKNVLIEVNPATRIPRTFHRFAGLMVQLLHKFSIKASGGGSHAPLLRTVKNPVTDYLPPGCLKVRLTEHAKHNCVDIQDWVQQRVTGDQCVVFVVGAFAHGKLETDWVDEDLAISPHSLSAALCCSKICNAFERHFRIL